MKNFQDRRGALPRWQVFATAVLAVSAVLVGSFAVEASAASRGQFRSLWRALRPRAALAAAAAVPAPRIDLRVLVLSDGNVGTKAISDELAALGVPFTTVDLNSATRPAITAAFLADTVSGGRRSKFQAIVLPNEAPSQLTAGEMSAMSAVEVEFGIREINSYVYPNPSVGLNWPAGDAYLGGLDGMSATATTLAKSGGWSNLSGAVPFDDNDRSVTESYGYLTTPLAVQATGATFEPYVTMPIPGSGSAAPVIGAYKAGGRERLVITASMNVFQTQLQALGEGIVNWATKGVRLGYKRNYLAVHVDDVFLDDARWSTSANCTWGDTGCAQQTAPIRMAATDAAYLRSWQQANNFKLDLAFNGAGSVAQVAAAKTDALATELLKVPADFRWINHTYSHQYFGCVQNFTVVPWVCSRTSTGAVQWTSAATIKSEVANNVTWANGKKIPFDATEVVTGEHSGLRKTPQEPSDNPNLAPTLTAAKVSVVASDASYESSQRRLGTSTGPLTLPRYPMNVFYNVATKAEEADEYNWLYTSAADGGSGLCENNPLSTCITPVDAVTGFDSYIRPTEARQMLAHVLLGKPYPHYAHQSNLAEDRILYPVLGDVLTKYRAMFSSNSPVITLGMNSAATRTSVGDAWSKDSLTGAAGVVAYVQGNAVKVTSNLAMSVPLTVPEGSKVGAASFGEAYGGRRSAWTAVAAKGTLSVAIPGFGL